MPSGKRKSRTQATDLSALLEALSKADIDFIMINPFRHAVTRHGPQVIPSLNIVNFYYLHCQEIVL